MKEALTNKSLVIIGGTTGIGLSAAKAFITQGANVVITGRSADSADRVSDAQQLLGNCAHVIISDARDTGSAQVAIDKCNLLYGSFDGLYHVAGGSGRKMGDGPLHELTLEGWDETMSLNLTSLMLSNQSAIQTFLKNGKGGTILNMGSVLGFSPSAQHFATHAYAAAKSAISGFSTSIAAYYATDNIRVNVLAPGLVETPMAIRAAQNDAILNFIKTKQPLDRGRIGKPSDLDGLAIYFMGDQSKFTTGQVIAVDGGWSVVG
jgi:NAD(P)-dependent dehydrogenase (short-subunit alcohol dehydrogenase family)